MRLVNDGSPESGWIDDPWRGPNVWRYGTERPCNLEGRYVHIVADYSDPLTRPTEIAICTVGVMGNYIVEEETSVTEQEASTEPSFVDEIEG